MNRIYIPLRKTVLLFILLLISSAIFSAKETVLFDIILFGDKIGNLVVTREPRPDGTEIYMLDTKSKAKILWINKENITHYEVVYKDGKLISSTFKEIENGEVKRWNNVSWDGSKYVVDGYKGKRTFTEIPSFSLVSIYFKDMKNVKRIFYETEADFTQVDHPDANTWQFKSSDGHLNVYHFVDGKIQNLEFRVSIATIKMVRMD